MKFFLEYCLELMVIVSGAVVILINPTWSTYSPMLKGSIIVILLSVLIFSNLKRRKAKSMQAFFAQEWEEFKEEIHFVRLESWERLGLAIILAGIIQISLLIGQMYIMGAKQPPQGLYLGLPFGFYSPVTDTILIIHLIENIIILAFSVYSLLYLFVRNQSR